MYGQVCNSNCIQTDSSIQTDTAVVDRGTDKYSGTEVLQSGTEGENLTENNSRCSMLIILNY